MRRRHRYIPFVWAGLFFGLATALPAESPGTVAKPKTAPPAKKAAEVVPASTGKAGADLLLQMAYAAYEAGNNALAIEKLDAAEKLQSNGAEGANLRGAIFLRTGQFAKASEQFRRAANLDPSLWVARFNVAEVPFRQKDFAAARRA